MMMMFIRKKRWVLLKRPRSDADGVGEVELYNNVCNTVLYRRETVAYRTRMELAHLGQI